MINTDIPKTTVSGDIPYMVKIILVICGDIKP